jgi:hypothetical protein
MVHSGYNENDWTKGQISIAWSLVTVAVKVCWDAAQAKWLISAGDYPSFCSIMRLGVYHPLDGMLVYRRLAATLKLVYWVERRK